MAVCYYEISQLAAKEDFIDFNMDRINRMMEIVQIQIRNQMTDSLQLMDLELKKDELVMTKKELISGMQRKSNYLKMLVGLPDSIEIDVGTLNYEPVLEILPDSNNYAESTQMKLLNQAQSNECITKAGSVGISTDP